jgi:hypothetical protein
MWLISCRAREPRLARRQTAGRSAGREGEGRQGSGGWPGRSRRARVRMLSQGHLTPAPPAVPRTSSGGEYQTATSDTDVRFPLKASARAIVESGRAGQPARRTLAVGEGRLDRCVSDRPQGRCAAAACNDHGGVSCVDDSIRLRDLTLPRRGYRASGSCSSFSIARTSCARWTVRRRVGAFGLGSGTSTGWPMSTRWSISHRAPATASN